MSYVVAQLGARMHYAVPRILHGAGQLEHFFTDICSSKGWPQLCGLLPAALQPESVRRIAGRALWDVPSDRITAFNLFGVRYAHRRRQARSRSDFTQAFLWAGRTFWRQVVARGLGDARGVYVFNTAGLEVLEAALAKGCRTLLEQTIAPRRVENALLSIQLDPRANHEGPLRVLAVGSVGLRKGSPYVVEAARALRGKAIFRMVGEIECSSSAAAPLSEVVELTGSVPRSEVAKHFAWADVFLLPSSCEGSATAVYEALSASLPVICTDNTGSVVRDGVDGFIIPIRDSQAIVDRLLRLSSDPDLRRQMAENAQDRARSFDLAAYGQRLITVLGGRTDGLPS